MSGNSISGPHKKFCEFGSLTALIQGAKGPGEVQKDVQQELDINFGINQTFRPFAISYPSSCTRSLTNLQQLQIQSMKLKISFQKNVKLKALAKEKLLWWMSNLQHSNKKLCIQNHLEQVLNQTDISLKGWEAICKRVRTGGLWSKEEQLLHINVLEHLAIKLALLTFTKSESNKSIHFQIDNKTSIPYLLKMGAHQTKQ